MILNLTSRRQEGPAGMARMLRPSCIIIQQIFHVFSSEKIRDYCKLRDCRRKFLLADFDSEQCIELISGCKCCNN